MEARILISFSMSLNLLSVKESFLCPYSTEQILSAALQARRAISRYDSQFHVSFICLLSLFKLSLTKLNNQRFVRSSVT